ncbi:unnamed protein product [Alopecurus aequalis]
MGRKGLTSIFSKLPAGADESSPPWPWPSCRNPQTASFREEGRHRPCSTAAAAVSRNPAALIRGGAGEMYKTVNSVYQLDYISADGSCFDEEEEEVQGVLELDDDDGFSTTTASEEWSEAVIRSLGRTSTDRFFVDSGPASNSILASSPGKSAATTDAAVTSEETASSEPSSLVEESVAVAVDSEDPYADFRASMEEMVAAHGLRGWDALEELLVWYLRINSKHNHALIVGAFVDLLVGLATPPAPSSSSAAPTTTTTATTMTTATSCSNGSTSSSSTSSSTCGCAGDATPTTATTTEEQCGGRSDDASRSPASSSGKGLHDKEEDVVGDKAGDDHSISGAVHISSC